MRIHPMFLLLLALCFGADALASGVVAINAPWVRPAAAHASAEAYLVMTSSEGGRLVHVESPLAARAVLRDASRGADGSIPLAQSRELILAPGGSRIVLLDLRHALKVGARVPLALTLELPDGTRSIVDVDAEVRRESPIEGERKHHHGHAGDVPASAHGGSSTVR